jgi:predicted glycoside hydrolase/deacetylase ChbG (UPF0249 family)
MKPNPVLQRLGFRDDDRVVIIHADDVGMCQATLPAFVDLIDFGLVSCGAVMVPCPWFPQVASLCHQNPGVDLGVHLTLTSEWEGYRWGPISTRDPASGLMDEAGYFHPRSGEVYARAGVEAVRRELELQVDRTLAAGIDVTHIDTHMGAVAHHKFIPVYIQLALQRGLPPMMFRLDEAGWLELGIDQPEMGMDSEMATFAATFVQQLEAQGVPLVDNLTGLALDQPENRMALAKSAFDSLKPGLTHFIIHPAQDTPELRAITPDWRSRVGDYRLFMSGELRDYVRDSGIQVVGYRALRDLMRNERPVG